eukprot:COSAG06_NODE_1908_length_8088_cov_2.473526_11_plen_56_part_00
MLSFKQQQEEEDEEEEEEEEEEVCQLISFGVPNCHSTVARQPLAPAVCQLISLAT